MTRWMLLAVLALTVLRAHAALPIVQWQTSSSARVYFVEVHALPMLDVSAEFAAGSAYDPAGTEGVATITHALLKEGSQKSSGAELGNRLAAVGALLSSTFDRDRAGYRVRTLSAEHERAQALDTFAEIVQQPSFAAEAFEREKARQASAVREELTRPAPIAERRLYAAMYPEHPYGHEPTPDTIGAVSRDAVIAFYRDRYRASGAVITIVGDVSESEARRLAEKLTAQLPPGEAPSPLRTAVGFGATQTQRVPLATEQTHIALGIPAVARSDPDYFALYLGNYVLGGGGFVSRLFRAVREERGLAYSVSSYLVPYAARGPFIVGLQTERSQTEQALATVQRELERFVSEGPTQSELSAAKKAIAGGFALRTDSNLKILNEVAVIGFYRLPLDWLDGFVPNVQKVTAGEIRAAFSKRIDPGRLSKVIVGAPG